MMNHPACIGSNWMMKNSGIGVVLLLWVCWALGGNAQETAADKPEASKGTTIKTASGGSLVINAKSVLYDFTKRLATFETNVSVTDTQILLTADRLDVFLTAENSVQRVEAAGNVVIRELGSAKKATAGNAVYDMLEDTVVLTTDPYLEDRDQGFFTKGAERVIYFRAKQQFKAEGENVQIEFGIPGDRARPAEDLFRLPGEKKVGAGGKKDGAAEKKEVPAP